MRDYYAAGGVTELLEQRMIELSGKEAAVYLPTGTMANQLPLSVLSEGAAPSIPWLIVM